MSVETENILIIGAGAAGLSAARTLLRSHKHVRIVEARARIGGRVFTQWPHGSKYPVELGAEFIHGKPEPLRKYLNEADPMSNQWWRRSGGKLIRPGNTFTAIGKVFEAMRNYSQLQDESFEQASQRVSNQFPIEQIEHARAFVSGFYAARLDEVSAKATVGVAPTVGSASSEDAFRVRAGYSSVIDDIASEIPEKSILLNTAVKKVVWERHAVSLTVQNTNGEKSLLQGKALIFTVPVGCWDQVDFDPPLPQKSEAVKKIGMGDVHRVVLRFRNAFWEHKRFHPGYLQKFDQPFVTFWTSRPWEEPQFTCWAGGSQALEVGEDRIRHAQECLASALGVSMQTLSRHLVSAHYHDWSADPFSKGAYGFTKVGGENAAEILAQPIGDTLFFAGEACHWGDRTGTVDGALETGARAASLLVNSHSG